MHLQEPNAPISILQLNIGSSNEDAGKMRRIAENSNLEVQKKLGRPPPDHGGQGEWRRHTVAGAVSSNRDAVYSAHVDTKQRRTPGPASAGESP